MHLVLSYCFSTGSKSDGQRSPNDTVFLCMDEIPYIYEDWPESYGENGEDSCEKPELKIIFLMDNFTKTGVYVVLFISLKFLGCLCFMNSRLYIHFYSRFSSNCIAYVGRKTIPYDQLIVREYKHTHTLGGGPCLKACFGYYTAWGVCVFPITTQCLCAQACWLIFIL